MNKKVVFILISLFIVIVFTVQNYEVVSISFLFWSFQTSRAIIIFVTLLIGFIIGISVSVMKKQREHTNKD